jgi:hypothetical protein
MAGKEKLSDLRKVITENLRVQRDGQSIDYIKCWNGVARCMLKAESCDFCEARLRQDAIAAPFLPSTRKRYEICLSKL